MRKKIFFSILMTALSCSLVSCGTIESITDNFLEEETSSSSDEDRHIFDSPNSNESLSWGAEIIFGSYEQDNNPDNGKEPVTWLVLESSDEHLLLLSKDCLDASYFHEKADDTATWESSNLRNWLNSDFYDDAFNKSEKRKILSTRISTPDNPEYGTDGGKTTEDKVFLLSEDEVEQYFLLPLEDNGHYYDSNLLAEPSSYAEEKGLKLSDQGTVRWFLRSPGATDEMHCTVSPLGQVSSLNITVGGNEDYFYGIRPAIRISPNTKVEITRPSANRTDAGIEDFFPSDWEGRYVIEQTDNQISVYCKMAFDAGESDKGWLFSIYYMTDETLVLPDYYSLGTYNNIPVEATMPWQNPPYSSERLNEEYQDMFYDVGNILDDIEDRIAELEHYRNIDTYGFDLSLYSIPGNGFLTGVYRLESSNWSEESKNELLHPYNQNGFISIDPSGTLYVSRGGETVSGTAYVAKNPEVLPDGEPLCLLVFDNGIVHPADCLQGVLTVYGMEEYTYTTEFAKTAHAKTSSAWTFIWEDADWWDEYTFADDIG